MLKPVGMRRAIRAALYVIKRDSFGCECTSETCPKHLRLDVPDPDPAEQAWIRHLWRLEELHHVGCTWGVNDLSWPEWQGLIWLAHERAWMDGEVDKVRHRLKEMEGTARAFPKAAEDFFAEGRKQLAKGKR